MPMIDTLLGADKNQNYTDKNGFMYEMVELYQREDRGTFQSEGEGASFRGSMDPRRCMIPISITPTSGRFVKQEQWEHSVADLGLFLEGGGCYFGNPARTVEVWT